MVDPGGMPSVLPTTVTRQSVSLDQVIRAAPLRQVAALVTYFLVPAIVLLLGVVFGLGASLGWAVDLAFVVGFGAFIGFVFWLIVSISVNFGVIIRPEGVELLRYRGRRGTLARYFFPWESLDNVEVHGLYSEVVSFGAKGLPLMVDHRQGRAILSDPRCPVQSRIPERVRRKLNLDKTGRIVSAHLP
jgi:hypothetical protein